MVSGPISTITLPDFYAAETLKLQQSFDETGDGLAVLSGRSDVVDAAVATLYRQYFSPQLDEPRNFCLLALGGYGRRELFPHSDIDLLFLTESSTEQSSQRMAIAAVLRELWDLRLRVGHSVHTLAECGRLYRDNLEFNVSLLDCRYLAGDRGLYGRLRDDVYPHLAARDHQDLLRNLAEMTRQRHAKYGNTIFHLEPNVKEAPGGLRDYHVCRWLARIAVLAKRKTWSAPEALWPAAWRAGTGPAFEFLCATRCFLHYHCQRDDNQLSYECQDEASARGIGCRGSRSSSSAGTSPHPNFPSPLPSPQGEGRGEKNDSVRRRSYGEGKGGSGDRVKGRGDDHQGSVAAQVGASEPASISPADWMRVYFRHVRSVYRLTLNLLDDNAPAGLGVYGLFQSWRSRLSNADFSVLHERIYVRQPATLAQNPSLLLQLFEMLAQHGLELSRDAERVVAAVLPRVLAKPLDPATLWGHLRRILLATGAARALRTMHRLGVLGALFPEFQVIDSLVIRDFFHRYTVDEHSFMTIENLHALARLRRQTADRPGAGEGREWEERLAEILEEVEKPELLYLALLFHDVGKGMETEDHVEGSRQAIEAIMARLNLAEADRSTVRFLVAGHLEMSSTLQRRDIFDPETVRAFASKIEASERLKMLALMTYADIKSVNPEALTPWKTELLWRLYASAANYLARSADAERLQRTVAASPAERILPLLPPSLAQAEVARFLEGFPRRYLAAHPPQEVTLHFHRAERLADEPAQVELKPAGSLHELTVITRDRPFLFASITGTLAAWGMSIVKADAFANAAGVVLDTFRFVDLYRTLELNPSETDRLKSNLVEVMEGRLDLAKLLSGRLQPPSAQKPKIPIPTRVRFDDSSSSHSTLLELITHDRPGLLYNVSSRLAELGCNIEIALIDTEGQKVIDVFYLTAQGRKLPIELQEAIQKALLA